MSSLLYKQVELFFLLLKEVLLFFWSKVTFKGRVARDERSIAGSVVIVTGANSGIGKEVSYEFAIRKAKVIMACRNLAEGEKAIDEHQKRAKAAKISHSLDLVLMHVDLADFSSVRKFSKEVKKNYNRVDTVVNNAGVFDTSGKIVRNKDGIEQHILVNYLSQFLLTNLLLDVLKPEDVKFKDTSEPSRVISVGSTLLLFGNLIDETNLMLEKAPVTMSIFNSLPYGMSKFYIALFTKEMSRRVSETKVRIYSMCPGYVNTGMFRSFSGFTTIAMKIALFIFGISPAWGCDPILYLALTTKPPKNGTFYRFGGPSRYISKMIEKSKPIGLKLWDISEKMVGLK